MQKQQNLSRLYTFIMKADLFDIISIIIDWNVRLFDCTVKMSCAKAMLARKTKEREMWSQMDAVILINPLEEETAGHPQPSAARLLSKQGGLTWFHKLSVLIQKLPHTEARSLISTHTWIYVHFPLPVTHAHTDTEPSCPHKFLIFQLCRQWAVGSLSPWQGSLTQGRELSFSLLNASMTQAHSVR